MGLGLSAIVHMRFLICSTWPHMHVFSKYLLSFCCVADTNLNTELTRCETRCASVFFEYCNIGKIITGSGGARL